MLILTIIIYCSEAFLFMVCLICGEAKLDELFSFCIFHKNTLAELLHSVLLKTFSIISAEIKGHAR